MYNSVINTSEITANTATNPLPPGADMTCIASTVDICLYIMYTASAG